MDYIQRKRHVFRCSRFLDIHSTTVTFSIHVKHFGDTKEQKGRVKKENKMSKGLDEQLHAGKDMLTHVCEPPQTRIFNREKEKENTTLPQYVLLREDKIKCMSL